METKKVQLNLYVPEEVKDTLQRMAAKKMLENPKRTVYATDVALEIIYQYLTLSDPLGGKRDEHK